MGTMDGRKETRGAGFSSGSKLRREGESESETDFLKSLDAAVIRVPEVSESASNCGCDWDPESRKILSSGTTVSVLIDRALMSMTSGKSSWEYPIVSLPSAVSWTESGRQTDPWTPGSVATCLWLDWEASTARMDGTDGAEKSL